MPGPQSLSLNNEEEEEEFEFPAADETESEWADETKSAIEVLTDKELVDLLNAFLLYTFNYDFKPEIWQ